MMPRLMFAVHARRCALQQQIFAVLVSRICMTASIANACMYNDERQPIQSRRSFELPRREGLLATKMEVGGLKVRST
jgi:hypothetical protein